MLVSCRVCGAEAWRLGCWQRRLSACTVGSGEGGESADPKTPSCQCTDPFNPGSVDHSGPGSTWPMGQKQQDMLQWRAGYSPGSVNAVARSLPRSLLCRVCADHRQRDRVLFKKK
ncbi:hypothetical protein AAFF_G00416530 [Aldrovandia affinis]|uniref:Uncharacterized protein n=1 Tax=Aldrovandia affinis TaxID=143900 RepID=A0AAD7SAE8_9TELE|nr:hypothetical protein AAFF_G00416530 [Aldrovandia affinis]